MKNLLFILATILLFASCQKSAIVNNNPPLVPTIDYRLTTITVIDVLTNDTLINNITTSGTICNSMGIVKDLQLVDSMRYIRTHAKANSSTPFNLCLAFFPNINITAISTKIKGDKTSFQNNLETYFEFRRNDGIIWNTKSDVAISSNHVTQVDFHGEHLIQLDYLITDNAYPTTNTPEDDKTDTLDVYIIKGYFTKSFGRLNSMEQRDFKVVYECPLFLKR
jgi:hypothetical protein